MFDLMVLSCFVFALLSVFLHIFVICILRRLTAQVSETIQKRNTSVVEKDKQEERNSQKQTFPLDDETVPCSSNYLRPKNVVKPIVVFSVSNGYCTMTKTLNTTVGLNDKEEERNSQKQTFPLDDEAVLCSSNELRPKNVVIPIVVSSDSNVDVKNAIENAGEVGGRVSKICESDIPSETLNQYKSDVASYDYIDADPVEKGQERRTKTAHAIYRPKNEHTYRIEGHCRVVTEWGIAVVVFRLLKHPFTVPGAFCSGTIEIKLGYLGPLENVGFEHSFKLQLHIDEKGHVNLCSASKFEEAETIRVFPNSVQVNCNQSFRPIHIEPVKHVQRESHKHQRKIYKRDISLPLEKKEKLAEGNTSEIEFHTAECDRKCNLLLNNCHHEKDVTETDAPPDMRFSLADQLLANDSDNIIEQGFQGNYTLHLTHSDRLCPNSRPGILAVTSEELHKSQQTTQKSNVSCVKHTQGGSIQIGKANSMYVDLHDDIDFGYSSLEKETDDVTYTDCDIEVDTIPDTREHLEETKNLQILKPELLQCNRGLYSGDIFPVSCFTNQSSKTDSSTCKTVLMTTSFCDKDCQSEKLIDVLSDKSSLEDTIIQVGEHNTLILDQSDSDDGYDSMESESNNEFEKSCRSMFGAYDSSNENSYRSIGSISSEKNEDFENSYSSMDGASDVSNNNSYRTVASIPSERNEELNNYDSTMYGASDDSNNNSYRSIASISSERNEELNNYDSTMYGASDDSNNNSYRSIASIPSERNEELNNYDSTMCVASDDSNNNFYRSIASISSENNKELKNYDSIMYGASDISNTNSYSSMDSMSSARTEDFDNAKKECRICTVSQAPESAEGESDHHICIKENRQLVLSVGEQYIIIYDVKEGLRAIKKKGLQTLKGNQILMEGCSMKLLIQGKYDIKAVQVGNMNIVQVIT